jgi:hypothetical protein
MQTVGYDKWLDLKIIWDRSNKFDVLYQRHHDEWIVVDSFVTKTQLEPSMAITVANTYLEKVSQELVA